MPKPIKKFSAGSLQLAIWENEGKEGTVFHTISFDKRYKDNDEWKSSNSLKPNDLPKAIALFQKAFDFLSIKESN
jgi:hypothetical protein